MFSLTFKINIRKLVDVVFKSFIFCGSKILKLVNYEASEIDECKRLSWFSNNNGELDIRNDL